MTKIIQFPTSSNTHTSQYSIESIKTLLLETEFKVEIERIKQVRLSARPIAMNRLLDSILNQKSPSKQVGK